MVKKLFPILALGFLLMGCTNEGSNAVNTEDKSEPEVIKEEVKQKTKEQYLTEFEATAVYQERTQGIDLSFTEVVDFEGDGVPEIVLGTNDDVTECMVTIYKLENDKWADVAFTYNSNLAIYLEPIGRLAYDDGTLKEALAFSRTEAQASSMSQSFSILHYNGETNAIEELIRMPLESSDSLNSNLDVNTFTITKKDGSISNYIFKNGEIIDSNGDRMGMIIEDDLAKLVGTTINNYFIRLEDTYYFAKEKVTEPLINEDYLEGGLCSFYETFSICNDGSDKGEIYAYYIFPANEVTVDDVSSVFNQTLEVAEWENMMEGGYSYTAEVMTGSGMYNLEFSGKTPQSLLESIAYIPN